MSRKLNTTITAINHVTTNCLYSGREYSYLTVNLRDGQRYQTNANVRSEAEANRLAARAAKYIGQDIADLIKAQPSLDLVEVDPCYGSLAWGSEDEMSLAAMEG